MQSNAFRVCVMSLLGLAAAATMLPGANLQAAGKKFYLQPQAAGKTRAEATLQGNVMTIRHLGKTFTYVRAPKWDARGYLAFYNPVNQKRLRWPTTARGPLQFYRSGQWMAGMSILPATGLIAAAPVTPPLLAARHNTLGGPQIPLLVPGFQPAPILTTVVRTVPPTALPPAIVELMNTHREELVIQIIDRRQPRQRPRELSIPAGRSVQFAFDRATGGGRQRLLINQFGQTVQVLNEVAFGSPSLYDLVVYERKVVSTYYDRTLKGAAKYKPIEQKKGLRSLGVVRLPGGAQLASGSRLDVFRDVRFQRNPGAVRHYPAPEFGRR